MASSNRNFNLKITGIGYLDRICELTSKVGDPFIACDIIALTGLPGSEATCRIEVTVSGKQAESLIRQSKQEVDGGNAVMVAFCLSGIRAKIVTYRRGPNGGNVEACLKSRLVSVKRVGADMTAADTFADVGRSAIEPTSPTTSSAV